MAWAERRGRLWFVIVREPATGRRRSVPPGYANEDEAREVAARLTRELEGREPRLRTATLRGLFAAFLVSRRALKRRPDTLRMYRDQLGAMVRAWSGISVRSLSRTDFEAYVAAHDWGPRSIELLAGQVRCMTRWARRAGVECPDFLSGFEGPKVRRKRRRVLTAAELGAVARAAAAHRLDLPVHLAIYAGLAYGDLLALTWEEVDLADGWIRRPRQKTDEPIRVPIPTALRSALLRHPGTTGAVCRRLPKDASTKALHALLEVAGVDVARIPSGQAGWHLLRHSYATLVGALTRDVATVGALLGHRPGSPVTLRYVHGDEDRLKAAARAVDRALA